MGLQVHMQVHIHMGLNYERRCIQTKQRTEIQKKGTKTCTIYSSSPTNGYKKIEYPHIEE